RPSAPTVARFQFRGEARASTMALSCHEENRTPGSSMDTQRSLRFRIEPMRVEHIPVVSAIERRCFTQPWPQNAYRREIQSNKMAHYFIARILETAEATPSAETRRQPSSGDGNLFERLSRMLRGPLEPPPSPALEAELR